MTEPAPNFMEAFDLVRGMQPVGIVIRDFGFTEGFLRFTRPADEVAGWTVHPWSAP